MYKLNGATGDKTGLGITLKVMAGDAVNIYGKSFWHNSGTVNNGYPISTALTNFVTAFAGTGGVINAGKGNAGTIAAAINGSTPEVNALKYMLDTAKASTGSTPRAYINWILFDEQFKPVSSGFDLVSTTGDNVKNHTPSVNIAQGGYLYVYCSNESNYDVFFDNLQVIDTRGPLLETDNYYPFGLVQSGISSQAAGKLEDKYKYNGKELQHKEFTDGSGLEMYDYGARNYDPQLGRWFNIDPLADKSRRFSPYVYAKDNSMLFIDPDGMEATDNSWIKGDFDNIANGTVGTSEAYQDQDEQKAEELDRGRIDSRDKEIHNGARDFKNIKVDDDQSDEFKKGFDQDINIIAKTEIGSRLLAFLDLSGVQVKISESKGLFQSTRIDGCRTKAVGDGTYTTSYTRETFKLDGSLETSYYTLIHELGHLADFVQRDKKIIFGDRPADLNKLDPNKAEFKTQREYSEIRAVWWENMLALQLGEFHFRFKIAEMSVPYFVTTFGQPIQLDSDKDATPK